MHPARAAEGVGPYNGCNRIRLNTAEKSMHSARRDVGIAPYRVWSEFAGENANPGCCRRDVEDAVPYENIRSAVGTGIARPSVEMIFTAKSRTTSGRPYD